MSTIPNFWNESNSLTPSLFSQPHWYLLYWKAAISCQILQKKFKVQAVLIIILWFWNLACVWESHVHTVWPHENNLGYQWHIFICLTLAQMFLNRCSENNRESEQRLYLPLKQTTHAASLCWKSASTQKVQMPSGLGDYATSRDKRGSFALAGPARAICSWWEWVGEGTSCSSMTPLRSSECSRTPVWCQHNVPIRV